MDDFERQLKEALSRKEQPVWFEAKVLAAAKSARPERRPKLLLFRWASAVAATALIAVGVWTDHQSLVRERAAGVAARTQLQLALKITVTQLSKIQQTVRTSTEDE
jgi:hypothetical protein